LDEKAIFGCMRGATFLVTQKSPTLVFSTVENMTFFDFDPSSRSSSPQRALYQ